MAVFRQAGPFDLQLRRRVLVDRPQQLEAALRALRVALQAVGPVAFEAVGGVDDQRLAIPGQGLEFRGLQLLLIGADLEHPLLFLRVEGWARLSSSRSRDGR